MLEEGCYYGENVSKLEEEIKQKDANIEDFKRKNLALEA